MREFRHAGLLLGLGIAIGIGGTAWWLSRRPIPIPVSLVNVDSLLQENLDLAALQERSARERAREQLAYDRLRAERDSVIAVSMEQTAALRAMRDSLPEAIVAPEGDLRALYTTALAQLDQALADLARKDVALQKAISADSVAGIIAQRLHGELADAKEQYANEQIVSADWKQRFEKSQEALRKTVSPKCGMKCGVVLGVGGTIVLALGIQQVQRALRSAP